MEGGGVSGSSGGTQARPLGEPRMEGGSGMERREALRREEGVCGGPGRQWADSVSDLAVVSGTPEGCSLQAAMFEHVSTSPVKATCTPY